MPVRTSSYVHLTPLGEDRILVIHALNHLRLVVDQEVFELLTWFALPRDMPGAMGELPVRPGSDPASIGACLAALMERGVLTDQTPAEESAAAAERLNALHGRDPGEALDRLRRAEKSGAEPYWSVSRSAAVASLGRRFDQRWEAVLFGDCEIQMEADFLREAAAERGVDLRIAAGFPGDLRLVEERAPQAIFIGALRSRRSVMGAPGASDPDPAASYLAELTALLDGLRERSAAPIFVDNLPEPTVQPLGFADRGRGGHRNRFRSVNLAIEDLAETYGDVHVIDVAAVLNGDGARDLIDDGLMGFTHFGSPGWLLQRPASERAAVHDVFPDLAGFSQRLGGDAYRRERLVAQAHMDALSVVKAYQRKKCVILDLDGTLWPGVLAETGAPFSWTPEISGAYSYIGLFFGLHEALKALKRRGVLLACVSKNDEALVRELWRYPDYYPMDRLLTPDDFVTLRINWKDKAENIASIAEELGFALDAFVFVDDHPVERARVKAALPEVLVLGEDPFTLRRTLLDDPRLQVAALTEESAVRTDLVRSQLDRERRRRAYEDPGAFLESLDVRCAFDRPRSGTALTRVEELVTRTTQFNATGARFSGEDLARRAAAGQVFTANAKDRFGDYGLVAAAIVDRGEILAFVMSCRVIGLGVETAFMGFIAQSVDGPELIGRLVETSRNGPVRHLYADNGFVFDGAVWRRDLDLRRKAS